MKKLIIISLLFNFIFSGLASSDGDQKRDRNVPAQQKKLMARSAYLVAHLIESSLPYDKFVKIINENKIDVNIEPGQVFSQIYDEPSQDLGTLLGKYSSGYIYGDLLHLPEHEREQRAVPYIKFLLSKGANPNLVSHGLTPLESAFNVNIAKLLLNSGADPNISGNPKLKNAVNYFKLKLAEIGKVAENNPVALPVFMNSMKTYQQLIELLEPLTTPQSIDDEKIVALIDKYGIKTAPAAPPAPRPHKPVGELTNAEIAQEMKEIRAQYPKKEMELSQADSDRYEALRQEARRRLQSDSKERAGQTAGAGSKNVPSKSAGSGSTLSSKQ